MRKYLGSKIDAFSAVLLPLFAVCLLAYAAAQISACIATRNDEDSGRDLTYGRENQ